MGHNTQAESAALARAAASSYWTEAEARGVLEAQEASGLSLGEFARRHGLRTQRLRWWKSRLGKEREELSFVPVRVAEPPVASKPAGGEEARLEVVLANGRTLRVGPGFDEQALVRLVRALEAAC
jgi:hypothetical protein